MEPETAQAPAAMRALEKKAVRASVWTILEYGSQTGLRVVSSLVLTRLLLPASFGEMTLVSTFILGINLLSDIGLAPSVVQSPRGDEPDFLNTAWTVQILRSVILWLVSLAIAWPLAVFYHDPRLKALIPVLALSTLLSGFNSTSLLWLSRHMGVRRLFAIDGSTSVVTLAVTIAWAWKWPSVWAIVAGQLAGSLYRVILSHIPAVAPGVRNTLRWEKEAVHSIVHFGKWIMLATAFFFFASQADRLILGRLISLSLLGIYGLAFQLSDIPRQIILSLGSRVAYPFIAKIIHLPMDEFRAKFLRYRMLVLAIGAALLTLMVSLGPVIIHHLYPIRYQQAAWMIPILSLGLWHTLMYQTTAPVLLSLGRSQNGAYANAAYAAAMFAGIPLAFHFFGMFGAVIAVAAGDFPVYLITQVGATRAGVKPFRQDLLMTCAFVTMVTAVWLIRHVI
jgi:O-antigen/teichoic acid export membrane protein